MVRSRPVPRPGFTLIELLVVMVIIGILIAILIPGVQATREAARNASSKNNLHQIAVAMNNHESAKGYFPPSWQSVEPVAGTPNIDGWSIHALLLPYLEQQVVQSKIDFNISYNLVPDVITADGETTRLSSLRVPVYISPAEPRDEVRLNSSGAPQHYPFNYAVNLGRWFIFDPVSGIGGEGAAYPDSKLTAGKFRDGMTQTLCFAEVKAWQPYYRNAALTDPAMPLFPADVCALGTGSGGQFQTSSGHTEWVDGRAHQAGFTTVFRPNTKVLCTQSGIEYDVDWTNWQEGKDLNAATPATTKTYAAVTARGYFEGMVNVSFMDGSVRAIDDSIDIGVWQALSTRAGEELLPDEFNKQ